MTNLWSNSFEVQATHIEVTEDTCCNWPILLSLWFVGFFSSLFYAWIVLLTNAGALVLCLFCGLYVGVNHPPVPLLQARLSLGSSAEPPSLLALLKEPRDTSAATASRGGVFTGATMARSISVASDALCLYCVVLYKTHLHFVTTSQYSVSW